MGDCLSVQGYTVLEPIDRNQLTSVSTHNHIPRHYRFLVFQESIFCNFCSEVSHEYNQLGSLDKDVCIL